MLRLIYAVTFTIIFFSNFFYAFALDICEWDNRKGIPCIAISKTPNTSNVSEKSVNKTVINRQDIEKSGAIDVVDLLKYLDGIDIKQNGQRGQLASLFMRGTNSNHTLVLLNGIPINDQSSTQGLHNLVKIFYKLFNKLKFTKVQMELTLDHQL